MSQEKGKSDTEVYMEAQNFNFLCGFLHNVRYRRLCSFLRKLAHKKQCIHALDYFNIVELGCGYGKTVEILKNTRFCECINYLGVDINKDFISYADKKYGAANNICNAYVFSHEDIQNLMNTYSERNELDLIICLETLEHIPERKVQEIVEWMASWKCPVFLSVPNEIGLAILFKNLGSWILRYMRHKEYSMKDTLYASLGMMEKVKTHGVGHIGFDYRWLLSILKQNFDNVKIQTSPFRWVPRWLSPSIYFICEHKEEGQSED